MKKIIATALCLTIAAPCFAAGRYHKHYPNRHYNNPHYEYRYERHTHVHRCHHNCASDHRTKTLAAVAGIAGIATVISAIVD